MKLASTVPGRKRRCLRRQQQRGLATLVVVAALFFIVSLVAAYSNRNLIFEQRTSANQFRSTLAFETAEAGIEWAVSMLNAGLIDTTCAPIADDGTGTLTSFRQRYLQVDATNGAIQPQPILAAGSQPTCVADGASWNCSCPSAGAAVPGAPPAGVIAPAFRLRLVQRPASRPGTIWLEVNACTRLDDACLNFPAAPVSGDARSRAEVMLALKSALPSPPVATLTVHQNASFTGSTFAVSNPRQGAAATLAVHAGGVIGAIPVLSGAAGEPVDPARLTLQDPALAFTALPADDRAERFFATAFAALPAVYAEQPAALRPDCGLASCSAEQLRTALLRNPGRILWVDRDVDLNGGALGTADRPVFMVIEGPNRTLAMNNAQVHGLIYARSDLLTVNGDASTLRGALIVGGNFSGTSAAAGIQLVHDIDVLNRLRWQHGSFVRVPGSWRDY